MIKAIILMGGEGNRFGSTIPKQFVRLSGKEIYRHTLDVFLNSSLFDEIILVVHPDFLETVQSDVTIVSGGRTRQESVYQGLLACGSETEYVVIHDAVRPFISQEILKKNIKAAMAHKAVDTCIPSADTIVHSQDGDQIENIPNRSHYLRGQTPQSFAYDLILKAHETTESKNASDDCQLVLDLSHPVKIVEGSSDNIKITHELDLFLAEQLLRIKRHQPKKTFPTLTDKTFAVTGGHGGIGHATCKLLEEMGARAIPISRSTADLTDADQVKKIFTQLGTLDGLINCIGFLKVNPLSDLTLEEIDQTIQTNFNSLVYSCKWAKLREGGHIINIASSSYSRGRKGYPIYSAAKAAVVNFTQGLAEERPELFINVVIPQRTNTKMRQINFPNDGPSTCLDPTSVAETIVSLIGDSSVTGTIIEVKKQVIAKLALEQKLL